MIDPADFRLPADRIARMVDLLGNLSHAAAEVARGLAQLLPPTVGEADDDPAFRAVEDADRATIVEWAHKNGVHLSMNSINMARIDKGLRPFRMIEP